MYLTWIIVSKINLTYYPNPVSFSQLIKIRTLNAMSLCLNVAAEPKSASSCVRLRLADPQQRGQGSRPFYHHEGSAPCRCASGNFRRFVSAYLRLGKPL